MTSTRTFLSSPAILLCGQDARLRFPATKYDVDDTTMVRTRYLSFPLFPKIKEVNFKTINKMYPCSESLSVSCNLDCNNCTFCQSDSESQEHLFILMLLSFWVAEYLRFNVNIIYFIIIIYFSLLKSAAWNYYEVCLTMITPVCNLKMFNKVFIFIFKEPLAACFLYNFHSTFSHTHDMRSNDVLNSN